MSRLWSRVQAPNPRPALVSCKCCIRIISLKSYFIPLKNLEWLITHKEKGANMPPHLSDEPWPTPFAVCPLNVTRASMQSVVQAALTSWKSSAVFPARSGEPLKITSLPGSFPRPLDWASSVPRHYKSTTCLRDGICTSLSCSRGVCCMSVRVPSSFATMSPQVAGPCRDPLAEFGTVLCANATMLPAEVNWENGPGALGSRIIHQF